MGARAIDEIRSILISRGRARSGSWPTIAVLGLGIGLLLQNAQPAVQAWNIYQIAAPVDDLHARYVRLGPPMADSIRTVTEVLRKECSTFMSMPGLASFYVFSRFRPPTGWIATAWPWLFDVEDQKAALADIRGVKELCVLRFNRALHFWQQKKSPATGPLVDELGRYSRLVASIDDYEIYKLP